MGEVPLRLTTERLHELFTYDPATGFLTWRKDNNKRRWAGSVAGTLRPGGYVQIYVGGRLYLAHRLVWLFVKGKWPIKELDHINQKKADNRISNLREVTRSENAQNLPMRKSNSSGFRGVTWDKRCKRWAVSITTNGVHRHIGRYADIEEASAAYEAVAAILHTHRPMKNQLPCGPTKDRS